MRAANAIPAAAEPIAEIVPDSARDTKPVAASADESDKAADDNNPPPAKQETPAPSERKGVSPKPPVVALAPVGKDAEAKPAAPRDSFDIPWPDSPGQAAAGELEWEKLETEVTSYKELSEQWNKKRGEEQQLHIHLQKLATHLSDLDARDRSCRHDESYSHHHWR